MELTELFEPVMIGLMKDCSRRELATAVQQIRAVYSPQTVGTKASNIDYGHNALRSAYLYLFGPLHSALVSLYLVSLQRKWEHFNQWFTENIKKGNVELCSLGGGPGLEMGCSYIWLETLAKEWATDTSQKRKNKGLRNIGLTVCDINVDWKPVFYQVCAAFRKSVTECSSTWTKDLQMEFIGADLLYSFNVDIMQVISNSDLVIMVKFLSAVNKQEYHCYKMLLNIIGSMRPGALLLIVDGRCKLNKDMIQEVALKWNMQTVFQDERKFCAKKQFFHTWKSAYGDFFGQESPMQACNIFVRILQKPISTTQNVPRGLHTVGMCSGVSCVTPQHSYQDGFNYGKLYNARRVYDDFPTEDQYTEKDLDFFAEYIYDVKEEDATGSEEDMFEDELALFFTKLRFLQHDIGLLANNPSPNHEHLSTVAAAPHPRKTRSAHQFNPSKKDPLFRKKHAYEPRSTRHDRFDHKTQKHMLQIQQLGNLDTEVDVVDELINEAIEIEYLNCVMDTLQLNDVEQQSNLVEDWKPCMSNIGSNRMDTYPPCNTERNFGIAGDVNEQRNTGTRRKYRAFRHKNS